MRLRSAPRALVLLVGIVAAASVAARCPDYSPAKRAYFGDLHNHTSYSFDAYLFGTRTDPAQSYAFARGTAVDIGTGYNPAFGEVPGPLGVTISFTGGRLDFAAVTDHSEWLAADYGCTVDASSPFYGSSYCQALRNDTLPYNATPPCSGFLDGFATRCLTVQTNAWTAEQRATEDAYDACTFTTFHAYEWTRVTGFAGKILHKNVFFKDTSVPSVPLDVASYPTSPALWAGLAAQCNPGNHCEALTIPHNVNQSKGAAFDVTGYTPIDLNRMTKFQRLVEVHQHKASSECLTDTADTGAVTACTFEVHPALVGPTNDPGYARPGLEQGIAAFAATGNDPLKFGFVGGTDNHDATPGNVGESTFPGFLGAFDNTPQRRLVSFPSYNPGGITGVWAEENTREAIWAALKRRETFATSGPRLTVRFYAYAGLADPCADPDFPAQVVGAGGTPMGGTLARPDAAPTFVVYALQDQVPLASIDIVKASVAGGTVEKVYALPLGNAPYCVTWTDPDFDPAEQAFWYARVLELPTWRWSHYDCLALQRSRPADWQTIAPGCTSNDPSTGGLDYAVQERAWTSSIWYLPGGPVTVRGTSLRLRDGADASRRRRLSFHAMTTRDLAEHRVVPPIAGSIGDPTVNGASGGGATLTVYNPDTGETATEVLPASGWSLNGTGTRYTFADRLGPVRKAAVSADRLDVKGGGSAFAFTLDEPRQDTIALRLRLGTAEPWCVEVPARRLGDPPTAGTYDTVGLFIGQPNVPPPEQCPLPGPAS